MVKSAVTELSDSEYTYYYTVTAKDVAGQLKFYEFYYNETTVYFGREETVRKIDGIVKVDGNVYVTSGVSEIERDEREYTFKVSLNDGNYVLIEQEYERGESEFSYTAIKGGIQVYQTEVGYEVGRNGRIEYSFSIETTNGEQEYEYEFFTANGENYVKVEIEKQDRKERIALLKVVVGENGNVSYEFQN